MKLHLRDKARGDLLNKLEEDIRDMKRDIERKMSAPYGDGSRSDMVNGNTDVLPRLEQMIQTIADRP